MDNDYELLYLAKEENEYAKEIIYQKYKGLMYSKAIQYSPSNHLIEDFVNESKLALYNAIENYQDKYSFNTYLGKCLDNSLLNYKKSILRNKNKLLNEAISIENIGLSVFEEHDKKNNPEIKIFEEYEYKNLKNKILESLTWKEELVFTLIEQNYTNKEISEITDNSLRTVYNIINRIRKKVSNIVSN